MDSNTDIQKMVTDALWAAYAGDYACAAARAIEMIRAVSIAAEQALNATPWDPDMPDHDDPEIEAIDDIADLVADAMVSISGFAAEFAIELAIDAMAATAATIAVSDLIDCADDDARIPIADGSVWSASIAESEANNSAESLIRIHERICRISEMAHGIHSPMVPWSDAIDEFAEIPDLIDLADRAANAAKAAAMVIPNDSAIDATNVAIDLARDAIEAARAADIGRDTIATPLVYISKARAIARRTIMDYAIGGVLF